MGVERAERREKHLSTRAERAAGLDDLGDRQQLREKLLVSPVNRAESVASVVVKIGFSMALLLSAPLMTVCAACVRLML
jgi:hypothetical protein